METGHVIERVAVNLTFTGFMAALLCYVLYMTLIPRASVRVTGTAGMILALVANATALAARTVVADHAPLSNLYESILYTTLVLAALFLIFYRTYPLPALGAGTGLMGVLAIAYASVVIPREFQAVAPLMPALQSIWLKIHVSIIMVSYAAFALACVTAVVQLVTEGRSAGPSPARPAATDTGIQMAVAVSPDETAAAPAIAGVTAAALPASEAANFWDNLTYRLISLGFPFLAIGIIAGAIWAKAAWGTYWSWDPKENWSLITLFVYAIYLHGRLRFGWTSRKRAVVAIIGFAAVLVTYVGVNYFAGGLHSYAFGE